MHTEDTNKWEEKSIPIEANLAANCLFLLLRRVRLSKSIPCCVDKIDYKLSIITPQ